MCAFFPHRVEFKFEHFHRRIGKHGTFACEHPRLMTLKLVSARATPQPRLRAQTSSDSRDFCSVGMRSSSLTIDPIESIGPEAV